MLISPSFIMLTGKLGYAEEVDAVFPTIASFRAYPTPTSPYAMSVLTPNPIVMFLTLAPPISKTSVK